jgi:hypothetical protein
MGEISEMMLDGTLCECCGVFLGEVNEDPRMDYEEEQFEPQGFPGLCSDCQ